MKTLFPLFLFFLGLHQVFAQPCEFQCWDRVYLPATTIQCSDYDYKIEEYFNATATNEAQWDANYGDKFQKIFWSETSNNARIHVPCEEQLYFDENVEVTGGTCKLIGKFEPGSTWTNPGGTTYTRDITSGMIMTKGSESFRFGKFEARLKIPGDGWWPAFWMWHHDEIDVFENFWQDDRFSYNLYGDNDCPESNVHIPNSSLTDEFHTFGVEWTPFKLTFTHNGHDLPNVYYRYYNLDGTPLNVTCENPTIPAGEYYIDPRFPESRSRSFRPIVNLAVLPKHGGDCSCSLTSDCTTAPCNDWGYPVNTNCQITGEIPAIMEIDHLLVAQREYTTCGTILIYGENCETTGVHRAPLTCTQACVGQNASIFVESVSGQGWLSQVDITSVSSSSNIQILSNTDYRINYTPLSAGPATITINYIDDCGNPASTVYPFNVEGEDLNYTTEVLDPCGVDAKITFTNADLSIGCLGSDANLEVVEAYVRNEVSGATQDVDVDLQGDNSICVSFTGYLMDEIIVEVRYQTACGNILTEKISIDLPPCDDCCPPGAEYDGANCYYGVHFNKGYEGFIYKNAFYTKQNCNISTANNCCPPGSIFDGANCYFGIHIPPGFNGFIYNNSFYTATNCDAECCPEGSRYDGANCYYGIHFPKGYEGFVYKNAFYTKQNCNISTANNCCPPGSNFDGANCRFTSFPPGYNGFVYNNSFYVEPNCEVCCPDGAVFDGANCYFRLHFPKGYEGFVYKNGFYTKPNCRISLDNDCCPPGSNFDGANCFFGVRFPDEYEGFVYKNGFYTKPLDCYDHINQNQERSALTEAQEHFNKKLKPVVFPNPFESEVSIRIPNWETEEVLISIFDAMGRKIYSRVLGTGSAQTIQIELGEDLPSGVVFLQIVAGEEMYTETLLKL